MKFAAIVFLVAFPMVAMAAPKREVCVPGPNYTNLGTYEYMWKNQIYHATQLCEQAVAEKILPASDTIQINSVYYEDNHRTLRFVAKGLRTKSNYHCKGLFNWVRNEQGRPVQKGYRAPWCGLW